MFSTSPEWAWRFRLLQAEILLLRGQNSRLTELLTPPISNNLADGELTVRKDMLLAMANARLDHLDLADSELHQADMLCDPTGCKVSGELARAHGVVEVERDRLADAQTYFRKSLEIARQQDDQFLAATDLLNLGSVAMQQEHYDESIDWATSADRTFTRLNARLTQEKIRGNLGYAYYKMGDFEKALAYYQEAEDRAHDLQVLNDEVLWMARIGDVYADTGHPLDAQSAYQKALTLAKPTQRTKQVADITNSLAFLAVQTDHLDLASQFSQQALSLATSGDRLESLYPLLANGELAARKGDAQTAERIFQQVIHDPASGNALGWEAKDELARLYEAEGRPVQAEQQYRSALAGFEAARSSLQEESRLPFLANVSRLLEDYIHFLLDQKKTLEALRLADFGRALTLREGLKLNRETSSQVNPQKLAAELDSAIFFYSLGNQHSYLWAITPRQTQVFPLPSASEINSVAQAYRNALTNGRDVLTNANPEGIRLFDVLVQPALSLIEKSSRVLIIPDGSLNNLNFETLLVSGPKLHFWIEDVTISEATSLHMFGASFSHKTAQPARMLLIGDPVVRDSEYGELPKAGLEMTDVEKHFAPAQMQVFARDKATETAYVDSHPETFNYIHFVAHGTASRLSPLDSAVVLSPQSSQPDSFKLYAREILRHPLQAQLVTISSCNASGIRAYSGEGLVGLSWAFLRAGAHNVIGALWDVSDNSTPQLMDRLYAEIERGKLPETALREAKLSLLHSDSVFRKPFYWAPFQLYTSS